MVGFMMETDFFNKAKDNLKVAEICLDAGYYDAVASRSYYAAFQAAIAALAKEKIRRDKIDHKWVQAEFSGKLIKQRKIYPARLRSYLPDMQAVRDQADYKSDKVRKKVAIKMFSMAKEIISEIEKEFENDKL
ncbi:MAG: HEPN domain-containing protein [Desulfococcaceae bacterium]|jgi:uncharacterized protein (UPF0332 family)|nr:HEPN domain-containing protein [Desulfococcaceae bacterium]